TRVNHHHWEIGRLHLGIFRAGHCKDAASADGYDHQDNDKRKLVVLYRIFDQTHGYLFDGDRRTVAQVWTAGYDKRTAIFEPCGHHGLVLLEAGYFHLHAPSGLTVCRHENVGLPTIPI